MKPSTTRPSWSFSLVVWLALGLMLAVTALAGRRVAVAWEYAGITQVTGFRLYYGTNSGGYKNFTNMVVSFTSSNLLCFTQQLTLPDFGRWYFVCTAVSANGMESPPSSEITWDALPPSPVLVGETWVELVPVFERSTNLISWKHYTAASTWVRATNAAEFFRLHDLTIKTVKRVKEF